MAFSASFLRVSAPPRLHSSPDSTSPLIHPLILEHRLIHPADLVAGDDLGAVLFVARLETDYRHAALARFEEDALESRVAIIKPHEAIVAVLAGGGGGEDDDVAFAILGRHAVAMHAGG